MSTKINWAANPDGTPGETVNPIRGLCTPISAGCHRCYARRSVSLLRKRHAPGYETDEPTFHPKVLAQVLRWRKPRTIFWGSMFDLFEERVPDDWIAACFGVMAATPQHVHVVLTKRAARMRAWFALTAAAPLPMATAWAWAARAHLLNAGLWTDKGGPFEALNRLADVDELKGTDEPLANVVLMVTAEDQATADSRIPDLLACPAATYGVSCEPLLGPVDLGRASGLPVYREADTVRFVNGPTQETVGIRDGAGWTRHGGNMQSWFGFVICGAESGPKRRPMDPEWARSLRDQCAAAGVPYWYKQGPGDHGSELRHLPTLDGRTWAQRPAVFGDDR